jgi:predicted nucleic acid-binding protein
LVTAGEWRVVDLDIDGCRRCVELIEQYADLGLGLVDASVVTVAERFKVTTLATLNHRDFSVARHPPFADLSVRLGYTPT